MKKAVFTVFAVLAVVFTVVSCGGGNINKVKNGVFGDYDPSITVGKALENSPKWQGGKWALLEKGGRDYVTYTVTLTLDRYNSTIDLTNANTAQNFYSLLSTWNSYTLRDNGGRDILDMQTSLTNEEIQELYTIFENIVIDPSLEDLFNPYTDTVGWRGWRMLTDEYYGPWFLEHLNNIPGPDGNLLTEDEAKDLYSGIVSAGSISDINDGVLTGDSLYRYSYYFSGPGMDKNVELQRDIVNSILRVYTDKEKYQAILEETKARNSQKLNDEPMVTWESFEYVFSFVINQDGATFDTNMMEAYLNVTLNCFDNLKAWYLADKSVEQSTILGMIYRQ
jgi:hypothetical protein